MAERQKEWQNGKMAEVATYVLFMVHTDTMAEWRTEWWNGRLAGMVEWREWREWRNGRMTERLHTESTWYIYGTRRRRRWRRRWRRRRRHLLIIYSIDEIEETYDFSSGKRKIRIRMWICIWIRERYEFVYVNSYRFSEAAVSGTTKIKASDRKSIYGNDPFSKL